MAAVSISSPPGRTSRDTEFDGLISLEDVGKLVEAGYQVLVAEMSERQHKHRFIGAEDWMKGIREELEQQRKQR